MNQHILNQSLAGLNLAEIRFFESLESTNQTAADWALKGAADYSLVIADQQTMGRGRVGRKWITVPGAALAFSLVLRPTPQERIQPTSLIPRFTGLGAVGVCQAIRIHYGLSAEIKWPNDILVNQRKMSGVLVEAQWIGDQLSALILGIGINIATNAVPSEQVLNFPATSLEAESGSSKDRLTVLKHVLAEIQRWRLELMDDTFLRTWEVNLAYRGDWVRLTAPSSTGSSETVLAKGTIIGLAPDGALVLRTQTGEERTIRSGEIPGFDTVTPSQGESDTLPDVDIHLRPVDSSPK